ncbi:MAG: hypothetical protein RIQ72_600 [Candidatus Parcubacteria bacterium]
MSSSPISPRSSQSQSSAASAVSTSASVSNTKRQEPKKILVTGCAGFIGSHFCQFVQSAVLGIEVIGIDNFWNSTPDDVPSGISFIKGDIRDTVLLDALFGTHVFDAVFHFAAIPQVQYCQEHPEESALVNVMGTKHILDAMAQLPIKPVFIFSSSAAVYGNVEVVPVDESHSTYPIGHYGKQKLDAEQIILEYVKEKEIEGVILRYFNVFGDGQKGDSPYATVIAKWCDALLHEQPIRIDGDGTQTRDFVHVAEVARANLLAYHAGVSGAVYNIAGGYEISLLELKDIFEQVLGKSVAVEYHPVRIGDIKRSVASIARAEADLHFRAGHNYKAFLKAAIKGTIEWWGLIR